MSFEEDGLYVSDSEHWELIDSILVKRIINMRIITRKKYNNYYSCIIHIPIEVARHLDLEDGSILDIAIRRHKRE